MIPFVVRIDMNIKGLQPAELDRAKKLVSFELGRTMDAFGAAVQDSLDGPILNRRTGKLYASVHMEGPREESYGASVTLAAGGPSAPYGAYHEYGARVPGVKDKYMRFLGKDGTVVHTMRRKGFTLPERSFMRKPFLDWKAEFQAAVFRGVESALESAT